MNERPYQVCLYVGPVTPVLQDVRVVDLTPTASDVDAVTQVVAEADLAPEDMRARVLFVADPDPAYRERALAVYAALIGFAKRRLDVATAVDGQALVMDDLDRSVRALPPGPRPEEFLAVAQVGGPARDDMLWVDTASGSVPPQTVGAVSYARRLRWVPPADTSAALSQLVAVSALRARGAGERLPLMCQGDEPTPVEGEADGCGVCLETIRRRAETLRRERRAGDRAAVAPALAGEFVDLVAADAVDVVATLTRLGAKSKVLDLPARHTTAEHEQGQLVPTEVWHCPRPDRHTHGDANPSARVVDTDTGAKFQCFRCDPEKVGSLRLVMDTLSLTADEAAAWLMRP